MYGYFVTIGVIVICCALLAWLACCARQPVIIAYFLCGVLIGPWGLKLVPDLNHLSEISHIGIALLLFLAGLVLHPQHLKQLFRRVSIITLGGYALAGFTLFPFFLAWGYSSAESLIATGALMFSSTILVVKLLPTTTLHQKHMGAVCIAILIAQDITAILLMLFLARGTADAAWYSILKLGAKTVLLVVFALVFEQYVLRRMMRISERFNEVSVMLCLAWCLGLALLAKFAGLSYAVGAFLAGVTMARTKMAYVLSEQLKPLRDFFLMLFFVVLGAQMDLFQAKSVWLAAVLASVLILVTRPLCYRWMFRLIGEPREFARETGFRLGQASEFSLLVALIAAESGMITGEFSQLIQIATIITMVVSSYIVVLRFPTPIGVRPELSRD